jgi:5-methylcytosine-specific restriction protein A
MAVATEAAHYPESRKELLARGVLDPDDPRLMRGMCHRCHSRETAREQPGGFNPGRIKLDALELDK